MQTTTTRPELHYRYAELLGQLLVTTLIAVILTVLALTSHYGDATTLNQGYSVGSESGLVELGYETVGSPGLFGHVDTPFGTLSYYGDNYGLLWCPTGSSDVDCGA